jgi:hypothetical protein
MEGWVFLPGQMKWIIFLMRPKRQIDLKVMKRMKQILLVLLMALSMFRLQAQETRVQDTETALVSGYVTDAETGERLSDAYVRIGVHTALTNHYGFYSLRVSTGLRQATISYIGYTTHHENILFRSDTIVSIALKVGLELSEIVVTPNQTRNIEDKGLGNLRVNLSQLSVSPLFLGERDIIKTMQLSLLNVTGHQNPYHVYRKKGQSRRLYSFRSCRRSRLSGNFEIHLLGK